jgi:hypothetical protein
MGPKTNELMDSLSAMTDADMMAFYGALRDPEVTNVPAYEQRIRSLLQQFEDNRIGRIGDTLNFGGGYDLAMPKRVKYRNREYMVLLESWCENPALALNANMDEAKPRMTCDLVCVRMVEVMRGWSSRNSSGGAARSEPHSISGRCAGHAGLRVVFDLNRRRKNVAMSLPCRRGPGRLTTWQQQMNRRMTEEPNSRAAPGALLAP